MKFTISTRQARFKLSTSTMLCLSVPTTSRSDKKSQAQENATFELMPRLPKVTAPLTKWDKVHSKSLKSNLDLFTFPKPSASVFLLKHVANFFLWSRRSFCDSCWFAIYDWLHLNELLFLEIGSNEQNIELSKINLTWVIAQGSKVWWSYHFTGATRGS